MVRALLLDIAGVLEQDGRAIDGSPEAVERLRAAGVPLRFVTNTSRRSRSALLERLRALGYHLDAAEVFTAPLAMRQLLEERGLAPHLLAAPAVVEDFQGLPSSGSRAVVLCDAAEGFTYEALNEAFALLMEGAPFLAVGLNRYYREGGTLRLDAGPFVRALEFAADVEALVVGKPAPAFFHAAVRSLRCAPEEVLMVGDDVEADVLGALDAGLRGCLVHTGKYRAGDEARLPPEGAVRRPDLLSLVAALESGALPF